MLLKLTRHWFTVKSSIGILKVDDQWFCWTLEDVARPYPIKIPKETCIWPGEYPVVIDYSERHKILMPHIQHVPLFEGIRFDIANRPDQVEGCIAVGFERGPDSVWRSGDAWNALFKRIEAALKKEVVCLEVANEPMM